MGAKQIGVLALCCGVAVTGSLLAGWGMSPKDIECAGSIGVNLRSAAVVSDATYVRHLAWVADLVVYGSVEEVSHDIEGTYLTIVRVKIVSTVKGSVDSGEPVYVNLRSGPFYSPERDSMFGQVVVGEATFEKGENVILFLTSYGWDPSDPAYDLAPGHFRPVDEGKWTVRDEVASHSERPSVEFSTEWINEEVGLVVVTQSQNCE